MARRMIDYRMVALMLVAAFLIQLTVALTRIASTYKALDLGLDGGLAGTLAAAFSLLPAVFVISFGRLYDRKGIGPGTLYGAIVVLLAVAILWKAPASLPMLFVGLAVLGVGQTLHYSGLQMVVMHASTLRHRDTLLGNYLLAMAVGESLAPLLVGLSTTNDPAVIGNQLLDFGFVSSLALVAVAALLFRRSPQRKTARAHKAVSLRQIITTPGLFIIIMAGSVCATAKDLMMIYIPVMGIERAINISTVGFLLSVVSISSAMSRIGYGTLSNKLGRIRLVVVTAIIASSGLVILALPIPPAAMFVVLALAGFGLGSCGTASLALLLLFAPKQARGTTMALRQMGTRIGQVVLPLTFGAIAAVWGVGAIFGLLAAATAGVNIAAARSATRLKAPAPMDGTP